MIYYIFSFSINDSGMGEFRFLGETDDNSGIDKWFSKYANGNGKAREKIMEAYWKYGSEFGWDSERNEYLPVSDNRVRLLKMRAMVEK